jgi:hypothetical protein
VLIVNLKTDSQGFKPESYGFSKVA